MERHLAAKVTEHLPQDDPVIQGALGPELAEEFVRVKRQEWVRYHNTVSRWEIDRCLTLF